MIVLKVALDRIIVFGTLANLQRLCSGSVISMDGTFNFKVCPRFLPALHHPFSLLQYSASRTFLSITKYTDNNISPYIHPDTIKVYRSPDSSKSIHHHCRFQSSGPQRGSFCFSELDTSWLSFPLRSSPLQKTTRVRSELESTFRS